MKAFQRIIKIVFCGIIFIWIKLFIHTILDLTPAIPTEYVGVGSISDNSMEIRYLTPHPHLVIGGAPHSGTSSLRALLISRYNYKSTKMKEYIYWNGMPCIQKYKEHSNNLISISMRDMSILIDQMNVTNSNDNCSVIDYAKNGWTNINNNWVYLEKTPTYINCPFAMHIMAKYFVKTKIIILIRKPFNLLISYLWRNYRNNGGIFDYTQYINDQNDTDWHNLYQSLKLSYKV